MANLTETGHGKNVANFEDLILRLELSGNYLPSREVLQLEPLKQHLNQVKTAMNAVSTAYPVYTAAVDAREESWRGLGKLVTRALNVFKASVSNPPEAETAKSLAKKVRGDSAKRRPLKEDESGDSVRKISVIQQSYDLTTQNFGQFIDVLASHPGYNPQEPELTSDSLKNMLSIMKTLTTNVATAKAALDEARSNRNNLLYGSGTGMFDLAKGAKAYVKGAFQSSAPHYKPILAIKFNNLPS